MPDGNAVASALSNLVKLDRHKKDDYNDQIFFYDVKCGIACGPVPGANVVKQASNLDIFTLKPENGYKEPDVSAVFL